MIGRLAPGAKVEPAMPGLVCSVSVIVAPPFASRSRSVATVTDTKASSSTMAPGSGCSSVDADAAAAVSSEGGADDDGLARFAFFLAGFATGLAVVTVSRRQLDGALGGRRRLRLDPHAQSQRRRGDAYAYANSHWYAPKIRFTDVIISVY